MNERWHLRDIDYWGSSGFYGESWHTNSGKSPDNTTIMPLIEPGRIYKDKSKDENIFYIYNGYSSSLYQDELTLKFIDTSAQEEIDVDYTYFEENFVEAKAVDAFKK